MTCWTHRLGFNEHRIVIAIQADLDDLLEISGGRPLVPELPAAAAPEVSFPFLDREFERFLIHVCDGEHFTSTRILYHSGDQAVGSELRILEYLVHRTITPRSRK